MGVKKCFFSFFCDDDARHYYSCDWEAHVVKYIH